MIQLTFTRSPRLLRLPQRGISIIEVLTAMVVAMIGVFGVMSLIPFAVKQAQTGLDSDAATVLARNATEQFDIMGYRAISKNVTAGHPNHNQWEFNWTTDGANKVVLAPAVAQGYFIDPLGVTENGSDYTNTRLGFPFNPIAADPPNTLPAEYQLPVANLWASDGSQMTRAIAQRMFRAADSLVFGDAIESIPGAGDADLGGPQQIFDVDNGGGLLKRQTSSNLSWSAVVVPTSAWNYKMYVLVYKNRFTGAGLLANPSEPLSQMVTARIKLDPSRTAAEGLKSPMTNVFLEDSSVQLESADPIVFRKEDWVMLINQKVGTPPQPVYDLQMQFYRVVGFADGDTTTNTLPAISLDGPDFDFGTATTHNDAYIVHLKDVIGVYERTFTPEGTSDWNMSL